MKRHHLLLTIAFLFCAIPSFAQIPPTLDRSKPNTTSKPQQNKSKLSSKSNSQGKPQAQQFTISPTSATFLATGGNQTFTVYSNRDWNIGVSTESWAHLERQGNTLKLTVDENVGSWRDDYFTIISGEKTIIVSFSQEQMDHLSVSSESLYFTASGGTQTISVNSSKPWTIGTKTYDWGHLSISGDKLIVKVDAYTGTSNRTDYFTIKSGGLEKRVNITQEAKKPYLKVDGSISDKTKSFEETGGRKYYSVSTSASDYEIWGMPSWCRIENRTSEGFTLVCEANPNYSSRSDYFKVKADGKEIRIDVTQAAKTNVPPTTSTSRTKKSRYRGRDYYRFPTGGEWQSMIGFNAGVIGHYHTPIDVYNGTVGLFTGKGLRFEENSSFAWDISYIGGGLFSKSFFIGFGLGVSGYSNKLLHKKDITVPLYLHMKWYMAGNSAVSPYIATSQGVDFYFCQDYAKTSLILGLHSRFNLGLHFRPDKYSKFGISIAYEFGFAPYAYAEVGEQTHSFIFSHRYGYDESNVIRLQTISRKQFGMATYTGGYFSLAF